MMRPGSCNTTTSGAGGGNGNGNGNGMGGSGGGGSRGGGPCGACKFLRRKCTRGCVFAPYFDPEGGAVHFAAVHRVFGASNASKLLQRVPPHRRLHAVLALCYEAHARLRDPVYGCVSHIFALQQQVVDLEAEVALIHAQLSALHTPHHQPPQQQEQAPPVAQVPPRPHCTAAAASTILQHPPSISSSSPTSSNLSVVFDPFQLQPILPEYSASCCSPPACYMDQEGEEEEEVEALAREYLHEYLQGGKYLWAPEPR